MARRLSCAFVALPLALACSSMYYGALEQVGVQKRHILADRIEDGREAQQDAQEQFQDAFERFKTATTFEGGELEDTYRGLAAELEDSEARAADVRERIASIEQVAGDLFAEWETEIGEISRADLRQKSSTQLRQTKARYAKLLAAMKKAERKMDPVLVAFRDQVLFLKHNLNAKAIASLETQASGIQSDVEALVRDLSASIREADAFLATLEQGGA